MGETAAAEAVYKTASDVPLHTALSPKIYDALTALDDGMVTVLLAGDIRLVRSAWLLLRRSVAVHLVPGGPPRGPVRTSGRWQ